MSNTKIENIRKRLNDNGTQLVETLKAAREALTRGDYRAAQTSTDLCEELLREREAESQLVALEIADLLRKHLADLHAQRGESVLESRNMQITYGVHSKMFSDEWDKVEELTGRIETFERHLKTVEADATSQVKTPCQPVR